MKCNIIFQGIYCIFATISQFNAMYMYAYQVLNNSYGNVLLMLVEVKQALALLLPASEIHTQSLQLKSKIYDNMPTTLNHEDKYTDKVCSMLII